MHRLASPLFRGALLETGRSREAAWGGGIVQAASGWERSQERKAFLVLEASEGQERESGAKSGHGPAPAWCQPAAPGPHFSRPHEQGSRQPPGKITSPLAVTFCSLGWRTRGPDPFKEPPLQADTDRHRAAQCHLQSTELALQWILLEAGEPLISGHDSEHPF